MGVLGDVLKTLDRPFQIVGNTVQGRFGSAGRQGLQLLADLVDAPLPGDWLPNEIARPEDETSGSEILGISDTTPGIKTLADVALGTVLNPISYTGIGKIPTLGGMAASGGKAALSGVKALPGGAAAVERLTPLAEGAGRMAKDMFGLKRGSQWAQDLAAGASAKSAGTAAAARSALEDGLRGVPLEDRQALFAAIQDIQREGGLANPGGKASRILGDQITDPSVVASRASEAVRNDPVAQIITNKQDPISQLKLTPLDDMLGTAGRETFSRGGSKMVTPGDMAIEQSGGLKAIPKRVGADELPGIADTFKYREDIVRDVMSALAKQGVSGERLERLRGVVPKVTDMSSDWFKTLVDEGVFAKPVGRDLTRQSPQYAQRAFSGMENTVDRGIREATGAKPMASKARTLDTDDVVDFLNKNPDVTLEDDFAKVAASRGEQQGRLLAQGYIAKGLAARAEQTATEKLSAASKSVDRWEYLPEGERFAKAGLSNAERLAWQAQGAPLYKPGGNGGLSEVANAVLKEMRDPKSPMFDVASADLLENIYRGIAPRGALMDVLAKGNRIFKPFATAGAFIPRLSFTVGNVASGLPQILSNPEARSVWWKYAKGAAGVILRSIDDGIEHLTGKRIGADDLADFKQAMANSGGSLEGAVAAAKDPIMKEAIRHGVVTDGFVDAELLADTISRTGWSKRWRDIRDYPAAIAGGSEKRMRYATFKALIEDKGLSPAEAARISKETFYDYQLSGPLNRAARDVIPFFQFTAKAIPQQARWLNEKPYLATAMASLPGAGDGQVYPYMEGNLNIPFGTDEEGNPKYLTSLRMPFEAIGAIPNLSGDLRQVGRDIEREIVGSSTPPLKTAYGVLSGRDPFFGSQYGSFDRLPGNVEAGGIGRAYNKLAGTGMIQPIAAPLQTLSPLWDDRRSIGDTALNMLTGAKVVSVDPDRARLQRLREDIETNPEIEKVVTPYTRSQNAETQNLLNAYREARKQARREPVN